MSPLESPVPLDESILEEACGWFIDFNEGELGLHGREQFNRWLRRSPEHLRAYLEIAAAWEDSSRMRSPGTLEIDALIAQAVADEGNVVPLFSTPGGKAPGSARRMRFLASAAALLLAAAGLSTWFVTQRNTYFTAIGEQRFIALPDGSTVHLNSRSRLKVQFTANERLVELLQGQALFQVKKDSARPFRVDSGGARVRAVGTQFDIYRKPAGMTVTVIEGRVAVLSPSAREGGRAGGEGAADEGAIFLTAGEQLTLTPRLEPRSIRVDLALATAWTQRKLIFDETPLAAAVAEFNRYNTRQIVIEDAGLAGFHLRGSFQATDPDRLVQFLRDRFGVRARERDGEIRISTD